MLHNHLRWGLFKLYSTLGFMLVSSYDLSIGCLILANLKQPGIRIKLFNILRKGNLIHARQFVDPFCFRVNTCYTMAVLNTIIAIQTHCSQTANQLHDNPDQTELIGLTLINPK
ncbi:hypothetical protein O5D80_004676 [Batrachochytrium dendrobatidis]|nr:hypothetical protein O5D80_004676 [Batrachochytrium dendrobatidis]